MDDFMRAIITGTVIFIIVSAASRTAETLLFGKNGEKYAGRRKNSLGGKKKP